MDRSVVASDDDDGIGIDLEGEVIPRLRYLAGVSGKQPAGSPDAFDVQSVYPGIAIKFTRQRPTRTARGEQLRTESAVGLRPTARIGSVRRMRRRRSGTQAVSGSCFHGRQILGRGDLFSMPHSGG